MTFFTLTPARTKIAYTKPDEVYVAATFKPPTMPETVRPPLHVAIALDVSGSMLSFEGNVRKIEAAKDAAIKLVENLADGDAVTLVTFHHHVEVVLDTALIVKGKTDRIIEKIRNLQAGGDTYLYGGLERALQSLNDAHLAKRRDRVMLFTDGQANVGIVNPHDIARDMERKFPASEGVGISTFGFGRDHNETLLSRLVRNGAFYYLANTDQIATAFGTELGSLTSTYATDVSLKVEVDERFVTSVDVVNDLTSTFSSDGQVIKTHDLLAEQEYSVIFKLATKASRKRAMKGVELLTVTASLKDLRLGSTIAVSAAATVDFTTAKEASQESDDVEVMKKVGIQLAARAQKEAAEAADRGDLKGAQQVLRTSAATSSSYGLTDLAILTNAQVSSDYATMDSYASTGGKFSKSLSGSLNRQTAGTGGAVKGGVNVDNLFANPAQQKMAQKFSIKKAPKP